MGHDNMPWIWPQELLRTFKVSLRIRRFTMGCYCVYTHSLNVETGSVGYAPALKQNFTLIPKLVSNNIMQYQKGIFFVIGIFGGITSQKFLKLYCKRWPKFEQVSKRVPTPRTLELFSSELSMNNPLLILLLLLILNAI
jgi:hypothetical protein